MRLRVDAFEVIARDVRVDLRGCQAGVPQELLHDPEVGAAIEQVRGERVAEDVGGGPLLHGRGAEMSRSGLASTRRWRRRNR